MSENVVIPGCGQGEKRALILSGEDTTAATQENIQGEQEDENAVRSTEDAGEDPGENVVKKRRKS